MVTTPAKPLFPTDHFIASSSTPGACATDSAPLAPFLIPDLNAVRAKIAGLEGIWRRRWEYFLESARVEKRTVRWYSGTAKGTVPLHASLAALVTGEKQWHEIARRDLLWMADNYEATLAVGAQDSDTWIHAAPMARRAISLDWNWENPCLSAQEKARLVELLITDSLKYPFVTLHHRVPPHANNQGLAMAFNCVTVGFLFGVRRDHDERARLLFEWGLPHLLQQIALLPPDGYGGEGSTYSFIVADSLLALACAVLEEISGEDFFERAFWPSGNSARKVLELGAKIIAPSGLLPAWDQHGYHLQKSGTAPAYFAQRAKNPGAYAHFLWGDGWQFTGSFAWMRDDQVWQWLWMPDPHTSAPQTFLARENGEGGSCSGGSWAEERVGGALQSRDAALHLFQMWDLSAALPTRMHMNPNSLLLEAWESLLTVDGNALDEFPLNSDPRTQWFHWALKEPKTLSWAAGSLGAHSTLWIDGDIAHRSSGTTYQNLPDEVPTGWLRRFEPTPHRQILSAEVAPFYRNGTDVQSLIRTSALVNEAFWVVLDEGRAQSAHDWTWQLVLRDGAQATPYGARLTTAEAIVLDVFSLDAATTTLHDVPGYPALLEQKCHHLRKTQRGEKVEFLTVLVPQKARRQIADFSRGWRGRWETQSEAQTIDAKKQGEFDFSPMLRTAQSLDWAPMELHEAAFSPQRKDAERAALWLARRCELPLVGENSAEEGEGFLLELPRSHPIRLWIDGQEVAVPFLQSTHHGEGRLMAPFVDVSHFVGGKTTWEVVLRIERGGPLTGGVKLHQKREVPVPRVELREGVLFVQWEGDPFGSNPQNIQAQVVLEELRTPAAPIPSPRPTGERAEEVAARLVARLLGARPFSPRWNGNASERGQACVWAARQPGDCVQDRLLERLEDEDWLVRLLAVRALGETACRRAVAPLCALLRAETPCKTSEPNYAPKYRLKEIALVALERIGDPAASAAVAACLHEAEFYGVRRLAARALGKLGDASSLALLERWTRDSDRETADAARGSLLKLQR